MKPSFALNLSHDGISLLHRAQAGWLNVGEVALDAPDLMDDLIVLRRTAADLEAGGITTKLVIPDSQILYVEVDAPGPSRADRVAQIRDALVGMTPYDPSDLVFDWRAKGKKAQVAVVARETLTEAETFATQYRFNPVSFVATPKNGAFDGEPFFGPTKHAVRVLEGGETIEPDKRRIKVVGRLGDAPPEGAGRRPEADGSDAPLAFIHHRPDAKPPAPQPEAEVDPATPDAEVPLAFSSRRHSQASVNGAAIPETGQPRRDPASASSDSAAGKGAAMRVEELPPLPDRAVPAELVTSRLNGAQGPAEKAPGGDASASSEGSAPADPAPKTPRAADPVIDKPVGTSPEATEEAPEKRRGRRFRLLGRRGGDDDGAPAPRLAETLDRMRRSPLPQDTVPDRPATSVVAVTAAAAPAGKAPSVEAPREIPSRRAKQTSPSRPLARRAPPLPTPKLNPLPKVQIDARDKVPEGPAAPRPADAPRPPRTTEADAMTVFGARGKTPPEAHRRPVGPALALAALLLLAVAGLWSSFYLGDVARDWLGLGGEPEVAEVVEPAPLILPEGPAEAVTDGPIAGIPDEETAATVPDIIAREPVPSGETDVAGIEGTADPEVIGSPAPALVDSAAPAPERGEAPDSVASAEPATGDTVPPSVPLPGIEVTDLQPEAEQVPPAAPEVPAEDVALAVPAAEAELPAVLAEEEATPPELVTTAPPAEAGDGELSVAALEPPSEPAPPPAEPSLPPVVDVRPPLVDTMPPDPDTAAVTPAPETGTDIAPFDRSPEPDVPGPSPEIASVAPAPPPGDVEILPEPGVPGVVDNPGTIDLVRLEEPPQAGAVPSAETGAPEPAIVARPAAPTSEEAEAFYARTGISVLAPSTPDSPGSDRLAEVVLSSADVSLAEPRDRGLPTAEELAAAPAEVPELATLPPLPVVTEFDLDERGLVRATVEGAITPQGAVVYLGKPAFVPPARPRAPATDEAPTEAEPSALEDTAPAQEDGAAVAEGEAESGSVEDEFALVDPSVFSEVPLLDDADLAEVDERSRYGGRTREELAAILPPRRPDSEIAAEAVTATEPEADTPAAVAAVEDTSPETGVSRDDASVTLASLPGADDAGGLLVDLSGVVPPLRPGTAIPEPTGSAGEDAAATLASLDEGVVAPVLRPGTVVPEQAGTETGDEPEAVEAGAEADEAPASFEDATELAVAESMQPTTRPAGFAAIVEAALEEASAAPAPPATTGGTRTASIPESVPVRTPSIPSSATVASTATEENALRLNRVNLIGVYGSPSNRRALVRLSSGRYVKVQVGDTVDGGRVAAIGDDELRYVKGGRTLTLSLPNS